MKKIIIGIMFFVAVLGCSQKEEQKSQPRFPGGCVQAGNPSNEERQLRDTLARNPKNVDAWTGLGDMLMDAKRFKEAVEAYQKSLEINPDNIDVRVDMGTCLRQSGKPDMAVLEYKKALQINPGHVNAHKNLAVVLGEDFKDYAGSIRELETAISLDPNAPDVAAMRQQIERWKQQTASK
ncbi:MAG: tetratricopeptide repeat protein [Nitrospirae bacterium]|nr:tetratricopeptide repeat protein [Nitrospirota bacterium]